MVDNIRLKLAVNTREETEYTLALFVTFIREGLTFPSQKKLLLKIHLRYKENIQII